MGARPSIIEANDNLSKYVGKYASAWNTGAEMQLSIGDNIVIKGTLPVDTMDICGCGELVGLEITKETITTPGRFYGVYEHDLYILTVRILYIHDLVLTSYTGFVLEEKNSVGETLFESRIGA